MVNKNRGRLDIVRDVLSIASIKVCKTRIMYGANLSFVQLEKYLTLLQGNGLLERDGDSGYLVTERGKKFLRLYDDHMKRSKLLNKEVNKSNEDMLRLETMCFSNKSGADQTGEGKDDLE
jgi:predicted transcriptional regulator